MVHKIIAKNIMGRNHTGKLNICLVKLQSIAESTILAINATDRHARYFVVNNMLL